MGAWRIVPRSGNAALRGVLLDGYDDFVRKLTVRTRCSERARDALQDAFLRIETGPDIAEVAKPAAYVMRIATNIAIDRRRSERRRLSADEVDALLDIPDDAPTPADEVASRSDLAAFSRALAELPERRRAILEASLGGEARRSIAARFSVSERTIDFELKRALDHARSVLSR